MLDDVALFQGMQHQAGFVATACIGTFDWGWMQVSCKCDFLCPALGWSRQLRCFRNFTPWSSLSSEAIRSTSSQEFLCVLRDPNVDYLFLGGCHFSLSWPIYIQSSKPHPHPQSLRIFRRISRFVYAPYMSRASYPSWFHSFILMTTTLYKIWLLRDFK